MTTTDLALWGFALVLGLVVILAAVAFLEELYGQVERIRHVAGRIWHTGKQVAANTATTWQLGGTSERLDGLAHEAGRHAGLFRDGKRP